MLEVGKRFTRNDASENFRSLITHSESFKFSGDDIYRIRREIDRLIGALSKIFQAIKAEKGDKVQTTDEQTNVQKDEKQSVQKDAQKDEQANVQKDEQTNWQKDGSRLE